MQKSCRERGRRPYIPTVGNRNSVQLRCVMQRCSGSKGGEGPQKPSKACRLSRNSPGYQTACSAPVPTAATSSDQGSSQLQVLKTQMSSVTAETTWGWFAPDLVSWPLHACLPGRS